MIRYIVAALVVGGVGGYLNSNWRNAIAGNVVSEYLFRVSLIVPLFVMGLQFGLDKESMTKLRKTGFRILTVPLAVVLGSILGRLAEGLILGINTVASMVVCAGYGWYTLAGPLMIQMFGAEWGALGFAVNLLREMITIVTVSLMIKIDKFAPIASGGATTMDTTLPVIVCYCGSDALITAFSSGFALSVMAPFTIIAIASLS
jgi:uncharacterized membrane protein YbjE (DUF340 family)